MKRLSQLAPIFLCLAACQSDPSTPVAAVATPPATARPAPAQSAPAQPAPAQAEPAQAEPANPEHIEADILIVNGQPREALTTQLLTSQLGRPDSIAKGVVECGAELDPFNEVNGDLWYFGKTMYEVSGPQAILTSFDATTGKFECKLGKLVLNQNTTLEDVRRFFPETAKQADIPASDDSGERMSLPVYEKGVPMDNFLNLLFKNGRLQVVDFFTPC